MDAVTAAEEVHKWRTAFVARAGSAPTSADIRAAATSNPVLAAALARMVAKASVLKPTALAHPIQNLSSLASMPLPVSRFADTIARPASKKTIRPPEAPEKYSASGVAVFRSAKSSGVVTALSASSLRLPAMAVVQTPDDASASTSIAPVATSENKSFVCVNSSFSAPPAVLPIESCYPAASCAVPISVPTKCSTARPSSAKAAPSTDNFVVANYRGKRNAGVAAARRRRSALLSSMAKSKSRGLNVNSGEGGGGRGSESGHGAFGDALQGSGSVDSENDENEASNTVSDDSAVGVVLRPATAPCVSADCGTSLREPPSSVLTGMHRAREAPTLLAARAASRSLADQRAKLVPATAAAVDVLDVCLDAWDAMADGSKRSTDAGGSIAMAVEGESEVTASRAQQAAAEGALVRGGVAVGGLSERGRPLCPGHRLEAALRKVKKAGPNKGRWFFSCPASREMSCNFFMWKDADARAAVGRFLRETAAAAAACSTAAGAAVAGSTDALQSAAAVARSLEEDRVRSVALRRWLNGSTYALADLKAEALKRGLVPRWPHSSVFPLAQVLAAAQTLAPKPRKRKARSAAATTATAVSHAVPLVPLPTAVAGTGTGTGSGSDHPPPLCQKRPRLAAAADVAASGSAPRAKKQMPDEAPGSDSRTSSSSSSSESSTDTDTDNSSSSDHVEDGDEEEADVVTRSRRVSLRVQGTARRAVAPSVCSSSSSSDECASASSEETMHDDDKQRVKCTAGVAVKSKTATASAGKSASKRPAAATATTAALTGERVLVSKLRRYEWVSLLVYDDVAAHRQALSATPGIGVGADAPSYGASRNGALEEEVDDGDDALHSSDGSATPDDSDTTNSATMRVAPGRTAASARDSMGLVLRRTLRGVFGHLRFRGERGLVNPATLERIGPLCSQRATGPKMHMTVQEWAIRRCIAGLDSLLVAATGTGKSLAYQLPAHLLARGMWVPRLLPGAAAVSQATGALSAAGGSAGAGGGREWVQGITVVISPLLALIRDQIRGLPRGMLAISLAAAHTNAAGGGGSGGDDIAEALADLQSRRAQILFISPERLLSPAFQRLCRQSLRAHDIEHVDGGGGGPAAGGAWGSSSRALLPRVALVAVDEAHVMSEWSHNFRPAYLRLLGAVRDLLRPRAVLGLTATAAPPVVAALAAEMRLLAADAQRHSRSRHVSSLVSGIAAAAAHSEIGGGVWVSDWRRPNLTFTVSMVGSGSSSLVPPSNAPLPAAIAAEVSLSPTAAKTAAEPVTRATRLLAPRVRITGEFDDKGTALIELLRHVGANWPAMQAQLREQQRSSCPSGTSVASSATIPEAQSTGAEDDGFPATLIYVGTQAQADVIANLINSAGIMWVGGGKRSKSDTLDEEPVQATAFHAGMSHRDRDRAHSRFLAGHARARIVVATIAFGMGVDKRDLRLVVHYTPPRSLEEYLQQCGRAGRDGRPALCHALLHADGSDVRRQVGLAAMDGLVEAAQAAQLLAAAAAQVRQSFVVAPQLLFGHHFDGVAAAATACFSGCAYVADGNAAAAAAAGCVMLARVVLPTGILCQQLNLRPETVETMSCYVAGFPCGAASMPPPAPSRPPPARIYASRTASIGANAGASAEATLSGGTLPTLLAVCDACDVNAEGATGSEGIGSASAEGLGADDLAALQSLAAMEEDEEAASAARAPAFSSSSPGSSAPPLLEVLAHRAGVVEVTLLAGTSGVPVGGLSASSRHRTGEGYYRPAAAAAPAAAPGSSSHWRTDCAGVVAAAGAWLLAAAGAAPPGDVQPAFHLQRCHPLLVMITALGRARQRAPGAAAAVAVPAAADTPGVTASRSSACLSSGDSTAAASGPCLLPVVSSLHCAPWVRKDGPERVVVRCVLSDVVGAATLLTAAHTQYGGGRRAVDVVRVLAGATSEASGDDATSAFCAYACPTSPGAAGWHAGGGGVSAILKDLFSLQACGQILVSFDVASPLRCPLLLSTSDSDRARSQPASVSVAEAEAAALTAACNAAIGGNISSAAGGFSRAREYGLEVCIPVTWGRAAITAPLLTIPLEQAGAAAGAPVSLAQWLASRMTGAAGGSLSRLAAVHLCLHTTAVSSAQPLPATCSDQTSKSSSSSWRQVVWGSPVLQLRATTAATAGRQQEAITGAIARYFELQAVQPLLQAPPSSSAAAASLPSSTLPTIPDVLRQHLPPEQHSGLVTDAAAVVRRMVEALEEEADAGGSAAAAGAGGVTVRVPPPQSQPGAGAGAEGTEAAEAGEGEEEGDLLPSSTAFTARVATGAALHAELCRRLVTPLAVVRVLTGSNSLRFPPATFRRPGAAGYGDDSGGVWGRYAGRDVHSLYRVTARVVAVELAGDLL